MRFFDKQGKYTILYYQNGQINGKKTPTLQKFKHLTFDQYKMLFCSNI